MGYFRILAAIPGFFVSSLLLKWLWNPVASKIGLEGDIRYGTAMLITITLWLVIAPLAAASSKGRSKPKPAGESNT